ncbi:MAG TPA: hypothetical protein VH880_13115 [Anaeromyxobacteraceae bacterium]
MAERDPRYRPYRFAMWVTYFAVTFLGISIMVVSVTRQLRGAPRAPGGGQLPTRAALRLCLADLEALYREQNHRAWALGSEFEGTDPLATWNDWARRWLRQVEDLADRCHLDASDGGEGAHQRAELAAARDATLALHRAYQAQVNRFAREEGDLAQAAAEALAHARQAVGRAR